jgi:hypothetical protein
MAYKNDTGYPSVTTIIEPYVDKRWFKEIHRKRGSEVHRVAGCKLRGSWAAPINPAWKGYVKSLDLWISRNVKEVLLVETRLSDHVYKFTGQLDLVCYLMDSRKALVDFKTSQAKYKTWALQTAGYQILYELEYPKETDIEVRISVRAREDGSLALDDEYLNHEDDKRRFLYANDLYHHLIL